MRIVYFASIWPQSHASAASNRVMQLIEALMRAGHEVLVTADGRENADCLALRARGITCQRWQADNPEVDVFLRSFAPELALFDRFTSEEKFGWRVRAQAPDCVRVLDTIDLHFLRLGREKAWRSEAKWGLTGEEALNFVPDLAAREIAAIFRSDFTLVVSDVEQRLLIERCQVPADSLMVCRLAYPKPASGLAFENRLDFGMIGSFRHPPNADALDWVSHELWPKIRERLPEARLHVWGAHTSAEQRVYHQADAGLLIEGHAPDLESTLGRVRVNLAPLRFGAGIKGKISDAWFLGTPVVTTSVGAEGMVGSHAFGGFICDQSEEYACAAVKLHEDSEIWQEASRQGHQLIQEVYSHAATVEAFAATMERVFVERLDRRRRNYIGELLWQQQFRASEYFSRWIETKTQLRDSQKPQALHQP